MINILELTDRVKSNPLWSELAKYSNTEIYSTFFDDFKEYYKLVGDIIHQYINGVYSIDEFIGAVQIAGIEHSDLVTKQLGLMLASLPSNRTLN